KGHIMKDRELCPVRAPGLHKSFFAQWRTVKQLGKRLWTSRRILRPVAGTLQQSSRVDGSWFDVTDAISPWLVLAQTPGVLWLAPKILKVTNDERGPTGLVARPQALAGLGVKVFIEQNEVAPVWIAGPPGVFAVARPSSVLVREEDARHTAGQLIGH